MKANDIKLLRALTDAPRSASELVTITGIPKSTTFRRLAFFRKKGWIRTAANRHFLLDQGRTQLATRRAKCAPALPLAHLEFLPSPVHAAFIGLLVLARIARRDRLAPSHHASFVLVGPPLRGKTTLLRVAISVLGCDPGTQPLHLTGETAGGLTFRRDSRGQEATIREAIKQPLLPLDEWTKGKAATRERANLLLHGDLAIPMEGGTPLNLTAVVMLALNPEPGSSYQAKCLLDAARLRRCILLDLADVPVPDAAIDLGDSHLERIQELGPAELPVAPSDTDWNPNAKVRVALRSCLLDPHAREVDVSLVALLVRAARAFFERGEALAYVLQSYLLVTETLGWTEKDWRSQLANCLQSDLPSVAEASAQPAVEETSVERNPFSFGEELIGLAGACDRLGLEPRAAEARLRLLAPLEAMGLCPDALGRLVQALPAQDAQRAGPELAEHLLAGFELGAAIARAEADLAERQGQIDQAAQALQAIQSQARRAQFLPEEVPSLRRSREILKCLALDPQTLEALALSVAYTSRTLGIPQGEAPGLVSALLRAIAQEAQGPDSMADRADLAKRIVAQVQAKRSVGEDIKHTQDRLAKLEGRVARREARLGALESEEARLIRAMGRRQREAAVLDRELAARREEVCDLRRERRNRRDELGLSQQAIAFLGGRARLTPQLAQALYMASVQPLPPVASDRLRAGLRDLLLSEPHSADSIRRTSTPPSCGPTASPKGAP